MRQAASPFAQSVGHAMRAIGTIFFAMYGFSWLFDARGVAVKHFLWPAEAMQAVKRAIRRFMLIYVPLLFVALMNSSVYAPHPNRESLGRIAFIFAMIALALFVWRLFRRSGPVMKALLPETSRSWPARLYPLWAAALVALPIGLGVAAGRGLLLCRRHPLPARHANARAGAGGRGPLRDDRAVGADPARQAVEAPGGPTRGGCGAGRIGGQHDAAADDARCAHAGRAHQPPSQPGDHAAPAGRRVGDLAGLGAVPERDRRRAAVDLQRHGPGRAGGPRAHDPGPGAGGAHARF